MTKVRDRLGRRAKKELVAECRMPSAKEIGEVLEQARKAAVDYCRLTGKPLGITGEIGECLRSLSLGLTI